MGNENVLVAGEPVERTYLARRLAEIRPVGKLPKEYTHRLSLLEWLAGLVGLPLALVSLLTRHLGAAAALFVGSLGLMGVIGALGFLAQRKRAVPVVREFFAVADPALAQSALDRARGSIVQVLALPGRDLVLAEVARKESWAGQHFRAAAVCYEALKSVKGATLRTFWISTLVSSLVRYLALAEFLDQADDWAAWGAKHFQAEFEAEAAFSRALLLLRRGGNAEAMPLLQSVAQDSRDGRARAALEARYLLGFCRVGGVEPASSIASDQVKFLGAEWPELRAFAQTVSQPVGQ